MIPSAETLPRKSRLAALLDHFAEVEDPVMPISPGSAKKLTGIEPPHAVTDQVDRLLAERAPRNTRSPNRRARFSTPAIGGTRVTKTRFADASSALGSPRK